jgi:hypothetical protein
VITDATLAGFNMVLSGDQLIYQGGSLTLANLHNASIAASAAAGGGVQITFSGPPIIISAGAPVSLASSGGVHQSAEAVRTNAAATDGPVRPHQYQVDQILWHQDISNDHLNSWTVEHPVSDALGLF